MTEQRYTMEVIRSRRKTLGIQIAGPGRVILRAPLFMPEAEIRRLAASKRDWIETHLQRAAERESQAAQVNKLSWEEMRQLAELAKNTLPGRIRELAEKVGVSYHRITVRNQKTRWGSCSSQGNLNFNVMLMLCPQEVVDYVIVHELCHRRQMNHSPRFWAEVARVMPEYQRAKAWLKKNGPTVLARMPD